MALVLAPNAWGYYVLAFDVKGQKLSPYLPERFSVVAVLADHMAHPAWPANDAFAELLVENRHANPGRFVERYLNGLYAWYLKQLENYPQIYGPEVALITPDLMQEEPIFDGRSSILVLTEYQSPFRPLATLRATPPLANGLLPHQNHFGVEVAGELPLLEPQQVWAPVPQLAQSFRRGHFPIGLPFERVMRKHQRGARVELKTYFLDPRMKGDLFPFVYAIARELQFFTRGLDGVMLSDFFLQAYGRLLPRYHEPNGFVTQQVLMKKPVRKIGKFHEKEPVPVSVMWADATEMDKVVEARLLRLYPKFQKNPSNQQNWLVYNHKLSKKMHEQIDCKRQLLMGGFQSPNFEKLLDGLPIRAH